MTTRRLWPRAAGMAALTIVACALTACGGNSGSGASAGSSTPKRGGSIAVGGLLTSQLDPGQLGYSAQSNAFTPLIFGSLFIPPTAPTGTVRPNLATGYNFNADNTRLTITVRPNVKFSDGTPMDAEAVLWNLKRYDSAASLNKQYFGDVTSMKTSGTDKVVITFGHPYTLLPTALANTGAGYMASPTAFKKMGAAKFAVSPVGAGPFKVTSAAAGQQVALARNPQYWDAAHVYLDRITLLNSGANAQASYVKLQSNAIQSITFPGTTVSPGIVSQASKNHNVVKLATPKTFYSILATNTFTAPFNNIKARQAVALCTDRESLAKNVTQGFTEPAYVLSGSDSLVLNGYKDGISLNPNGYDPAKGKALVQQLGGLSFTLQNNQNTEVLTGLQQQWSACGMKVNININSTYVANVQSGNYQMSYVTVPNFSFNPALWTTYQNPNTPQGAHGFRDANITTMINKAMTLSDPTQIKALWRNIWKAENTLVVDTPVLGAPNYIFNSKCLAGVQTYNGAVYDHAYLTC